MRTFIKRQNWIRKTERQDEEAAKVAEQDLIERHCAPLLAQAELRSMAGLFGGGDLGLDIAAHILELRKGLPPGTLGPKTHPRPGQAPSAHPRPKRIKPNQTGSNPIKPIFFSRSRAGRPSTRPATCERGGRPCRHSRDNE